MDGAEPAARWDGSDEGGWSDVATCRELVELVTDYLDGALPPGRHAEVVAHLEQCADCMRYLTQVHSTSLALGSVPTASLTPEQRAVAVEAFRAWCAAAHAPVGVRRPGWWRWWRLTGRG